MGDGVYKEQSGGLYGHGQNVPPQSHLQAAQVQTALIVPRDALGNPSDAGKIVLISLGMSNTTQEFSALQDAGRRGPEQSAEGGHCRLRPGRSGGLSVGLPAADQPTDGRLGTSWTSGFSRRT